MKNVKAQFYVSDVQDLLMKAETALTEAHALAEKEDNKAVITESMAGVENALRNLQNFRD